MRSNQVCVCGLDKCNTNKGDYVFVLDLLHAILFHHPLSINFELHLAVNNESEVEKTEASISTQPNTTAS